MKIIRKVCKNKKQLEIHEENYLMRKKNKEREYRNPKRKMSEKNKQKLKDYAKIRCKRHLNTRE